MGGSLLVVGGMSLRRPPVGACQPVNQLAGGSNCGTGTSSDGAGRMSGPVNGGPAATTGAITGATATATTGESVRGGFGESGAHASGGE